MVSVERRHILLIFPSSIQIPPRSFHLRLLLILALLAAFMAMPLPLRGLQLIAKVLLQRLLAFQFSLRLAMSRGSLQWPPVAPMRASLGFPHLGHSHLRMREVWSFQAAPLMASPSSLGLSPFLVAPFLASLILPSQMAAQAHLLLPMPA